MLKIKNDVDLKELTKYGFKKLEYDTRGHKYSWKRFLDNVNYYELYIARNNRISINIKNEYGFNHIVIKEKLQDKLYDLIQGGLIEKVDK